MKVAKTYREQANEVIDSVLKAIDETKKSDSIKRIERILSQIDPKILEHEVITDLGVLREAIADYKGIERAGLTPEEYIEEKESAFEAVDAAAQELDIDEDALEELESSEKLPGIVVTVADCEAKYSAVELKDLARRSGISPSGSKRDLCRELIRAGAVK